ncbi:MAG: stress protein, partial [Thermoplasmatota archaeon]
MAPMTAGGALPAAAGPALPSAVTIPADQALPPAQGVDAAAHEPAHVVQQQESAPAPAPAPGPAPAPVADTQQQ